MKRFWLALTAIFLLSTPIFAKAYELTPAQQICNPKTLWVKVESRRLWDQHASWTRQAIQATLDDSPAQSEITDRLLRNQDDIGDLFKDFYGNDAGAQVANLLRAHIQLTLEVLNALKNNDKAAYKEAMTRWYGNGDEFARFLSSLNPYYNADVVRKLMNEHLELIEGQATAHHEEKWDKEIYQADQDEKQVAKMADFFAAGLINQFPESFQMD